MKTKIGKSVFILITVCGLILFTGFIQSDKGNKIPEKTFDLLYNKNFSLQGNTKYIYVGMEKCALTCHNNKEMGFQYDIVRKSSHANAFKDLSSRKAIRIAENANLKEMPDESAICLKCHVTGGGLDSSSYSSTYKQEEGVTCEACHKGEFITKAFIPKKEVCLNCHNNSVHNIPKFNFKNDCKRIAHPKPVAKKG
jgi:hypothetical protein